MSILNQVKKTKKEKISTATGGSQTPSEIDQKNDGSSEVITFDFSDVIVKPVLSEKAAVLASAHQYIFLVKKEANRIQVSSAIKRTYGVTPVSVNILNVTGKKVRFGKRQGKRSDWKKAIVTLPADQIINVYEGV